MISFFIFLHLPKKELLLLNSIKKLSFVKLKSAFVSFWQIKTKKGEPGARRRWLAGKRTKIPGSPFLKSVKIAILILTKKLFLSMFLTDKKVWQN